MSPTRAIRTWRPASEIAYLDLEVELGRAATLHVRRVKNGSAHPLRGDEVRALRDLHRNPRTQAAKRFTPSTRTKKWVGFFIFYGRGGGAMLSLIR
jgi:hypothetical protein